MTIMLAVMPNKDQLSELHTHVLYELEDQYENIEQIG